MRSLAWDSVRGEFTFDGSWRDIYVLGTDLAGWQRMLNGLRATRYNLSYFRDGKPVELPARAEDAFPLEGECDRLLSVRFCGVLANCHFFTPDEIEFDIDPREVVGQPQLDGVFGFMRCLAESVGRDGILCPENCPRAVVFRVRPGASVVEHHGFGWWHGWRK
jgi:hypothetical protein